MLLKLPLLNQAMEIGNARIELKPGEQRVTIASAAALGAHWQGTIWRSANPAPVAGGVATPAWEFDLTADHLDAAELDRWIGSRARPNWLARLFAPEKTTVAQISGPGPLSQLHAHGDLRADSFTLTPLEVRTLHTQVEMIGRKVNFSQFEAKLDGGAISGGLLASLDADPSYSLHATVKDVSITELAAANPELRDRVSGLLSGDVRLTMHGVGREKLLDSLKGEGHVFGNRAEIRGLDLSSGAEAPSSPELSGQFSSVNADLSVEARKIRFEKIALVEANGSYEGRGMSDFSRTIIFQLWPRVQLPGLKRTDPHPPERSFRVTGALEAPLVFVEPISTSTTQPVPASVRH
jgi:hypothetical protein